MVRHVPDRLDICDNNILCWYQGISQPCPKDE